MKIINFFIFLFLTSCANEQLVKQIADKQIPLCLNSKANQNYSLTIYAYNDVKKNVRLDKASEELQKLDAKYDILAKEILPQLLLKSSIRLYKNKEDEDSIALDVKEGTKLLDYYRLHRQIYFDDLSIISTSPTGDEVAVCLTSNCSGLIIPRNNKIIENHAESGAKASLFEVKENPYEIIKPVPYRSYDELNKPSTFYFLFDILSKSGLSLGDYFKNNNFLVPELEQEKLCKDVRARLPDIPDGECFKYPFKDKDAYLKYYSEHWLGNGWKGGQSNLNSSGALKCCAKGEGYCYNNGGPELCEITDIQKMLYMDAVARDYIEKTTFVVDKKNEGKWTIYKIKADADFICKFGRDKNEILTN